MHSDGHIKAEKLRIGNQEWTTYAIGGTPAQAVLHAIMEILPEKPDLVVSGINYGENVGHSITISGTVMAAFEAASNGIKAMAVSLELPEDYHFGYSTKVDFSTAAFFTSKFAKILLEEEMPYDVDMLKIDVPLSATPYTDWRMTRVARHRYFKPTLKRAGGWGEQGSVGYTLDLSLGDLTTDSDIYTLAHDKLVSVTPLSLDMTSRVDLRAFENKIRGNNK